MRKSTVIAIVQNKGGQSKTSLAVHLCGVAAARGYRVLLVDMDSQGSATKALGIKLDDHSLTVYDLLRKKASPAGVTRTVHGIDVWPAASDLADLDIEFGQKPSGPFLLRDALDRADAYDFAFVDTPPNLGLAVIASLAAASHYLVPITPGYLSIAGLINLEENVSQVKTYINRDLELLGVVLTRVDGRTRIADKTRQFLVENYGQMMLRTVVPELVAFTECPGHGCPINVYRSGSRAHQVIEDLFEEVKSRVALS